VWRRVEKQSTLPSGNMYYNSREGYGPNKVAAEHVLLDSGDALRPHPVACQ